MFIYVHVSEGATEARRWYQITQNWGYRSLRAAWCRSCKLNSGPLEEQQASLTAKPSPQCLLIIIIIIIIIIYHHYHYYYFDIGSYAVQADFKLGM
ncbi:hypothetical protein I79_014600 [Cricetulus griseus]|uniref:Uncharacterized protein n=1 Tax=Cricetulus griseus TaxID=10029 RepID=G3HUI9_CRIGR|nr:hypothetical protein I79_014600 [Cricetulus griseus]